MKSKYPLTPTTIHNNKSITWIYESPDKGKTIYRRPFGKTGPKELIIFNLPVSLN